MQRAAGGGALAPFGRQVDFCLARALFDLDLYRSMSQIDWRAGTQLDRCRHLRSDHYIILVSMSQTIGMTLVSPTANLTTPVDQKVIPMTWVSRHPPRCLGNRFGP